MATLQAGKLRHRVSLQSWVKTQDENTGAIIEGWDAGVTIWASVEPLSAREFIQSSAGQSQITARIVIRYREGVDATMRIVHRGRFYNIQGVLADKDSGLEYLTLPVSEGVNAG